MEQPQPEPQPLQKEDGVIPENAANCCKHNIVYDHIDITPDRSENIWYCDKCWESFDQGTTKA